MLDCDWHVERQCLGLHERGGDFTPYPSGWLITTRMRAYLHVCVYVTLNVLLVNVSRDRRGRSYYYYYHWGDMGTIGGHPPTDTQFSSHHPPPPPFNSIRPRGNKVKVATGWQVGVGWRVASNGTHVAPMIIIRPPPPVSGNID